MERKPVAPNRLDIAGRRVALVIAVLSASVIGLAQQSNGSSPNANPRNARANLVLVADGLTNPTAIAAANDATSWIYVAEQQGKVRVLTSTLQPAPFLDISDRVLSGVEQGLLGLAFHPDFAHNGFFYVTYTDSQGALRLSRFHVDPGSSVAEASTEAVILRIPHPGYQNHNGGQIAFDSHGLLYLGTGDGGGDGDPNGNAQNPQTLLGKILRIDIDHACGSMRYCIPRGNPFASNARGRKEILHIGLRNPWRFSFDKNGPIWITDVGEDRYEEINTLSAGASGRNFGWNCYEGSSKFHFKASCKRKSFTGPIYQYAHQKGRCAIIGGYVYRGSAYASLLGGVYLYADYCSGEIWGIARMPNGKLVNAALSSDSSRITTFGAASNGEIYLADADGNLLHLTASRR